MHIDININIVNLRLPSFVDARTRTCGVVGGGQAAESLEPGWAVRGCSLAGALGGAASAAGSCRPAAVPCGDGRGGAARVRRRLWESRRGTKGEGDWESWRVPGPGGLAAVAAMAECPS